MTAQSRGGDIARQFEGINGSPQYLGTIQSTGTNVISNLSGAIRKSMRLMVQPDAAGYIMPANAPVTPTTPNVTNSATNGVKLAADEKFYICLSQDDNVQSAQNG